MIFAKSRFLIRGTIFIDFHRFLAPFWKPKSLKIGSGEASENSTFFGTLFLRFCVSFGAHREVHFATFRLFLAVWSALGAALGAQRGSGGISR